MALSKQHRTDRKILKAKLACDILQVVILTAIALKYFGLL